MSEPERIIEVSGYSKIVPINWHEDPTRHLLNRKPVNAKRNSDSKRTSSSSVNPSKNDSSNRADA